MNLLSGIDLICCIDQSAREAIMKVVRQRILPKGAILLNQGDIANEVYFIEEGIVRGFYYHDKKEVTSWIASDGKFIWPLPSYLFQKPSNENIQLLELTKVSSIKRHDMDELKHTHIVFNELQVRIMERYINLYDIRIQMLLLKAEERLEAYSQMFPDLYNRVPQRYIASYLGIDPATLSRVRGKYRN